MKKVTGSVLACGMLMLSSCITRSHVEQRVVELPATNPQSTFQAAQELRQSLLTGGIGTDIQQHFPNLTEKQFAGLFITANTANFNGKKSVFLMSGIRFSGELPEAAAIADYIGDKVAAAVASRFP
jgi:hypothetical protein